MPPALRRFDGAVVDRLTASWTATNVAIDQELRGDLDKLRARSRDLHKNNEHAAKFNRLVRNNVVGPEGFAFYSRAMREDGVTPDTGDRNAIEAAFWDFCQARHCHVAGRGSLVTIIRGAVTSLSRDGEWLIRRVRNRGKYGYQLQPLNVDRLDTKFNRAPAKGYNAVIMGVEVDEIRTPVAYHVWTSASAGMGANSRRERERIPANEIFHGFVPQEEEQTRGVPWLHAAMRILNDLKGYREAAVIAARVGASKMGLWVTPDGGPPPGTEASGNSDMPALTSAEPGTFDYAPEGYTFKEYNPAYPHDQFDAFCKATLRGVASAIGVAYSSLANDLENVNYSSIRAGVLDERDEWVVVQSLVIEQLLQPLFEDWLEMSLLRGAIRLPTGAALPATRLDKFRAHVWHGRRWQWVDPEKDITASAIALSNRLASPQQVAMQTGRDIEDILDDFVAFEAMCAARGITPPTFGAPSAQPPKPPE